MGAGGRSRSQEAAPGQAGTGSWSWGSGRGGSDKPLLRLCTNFCPQVGEKLIQDFLDKARSLPVSTMSEDEVRVELRRMKQELVAEGNAYIGDILARCGPLPTA